MIIWIWLGLSMARENVIARIFLAFDKKNSCASTCNQCQQSRKLYFWYQGDLNQGPSGLRSGILSTRPQGIAAKA